MTIDPVALLQRYHAALNDYDERTVKAMFAEDAIYVSPGVNGPDRGARGHHRRLHGLFCRASGPGCNR